MGRMTRAHNDSNVLCLGGKITGVFEALDILEIWLKTPYEAGRHSISLGLIGEAEQAMSGGSKPETLQHEYRPQVNACRSRALDSPLSLVGSFPKIPALGGCKRFKARTFPALAVL
jgi:Ribose/Galactose Isomerase